jgi:hypothetical protein
MRSFDRELPVEAKPDHLLESLAVAGEELGQGQLGAVASASEQFGQVVGFEHRGTSGA